MGLLKKVVDWISRRRLPQSPPGQVPPTSGNVLDDLIAMHNSIRRQYKLPPLRQESHLMTTANEHAAWMQSTGMMVHGDPGSRLTAAGYQYRAYGENIAEGYPNVQAVMNGWMHSAGHRRNILTPYFTDIGVGVVGKYWCVDFGTKDPNSPQVKFAYGGIINIGWLGQ